jgi:hypothetical protein
MVIERRYERDVDLLLAEEFAVNPIFAERFKAVTKFNGQTATVIDYWVSKSDNLGESDLIIIYQMPDGRRFALLIEDKVDAPLQPDQAARYRQRANRDCKLGIYGDYEVILCAPRYYIDNRSASDLSDFDKLVPLEQVAQMLHAPGDERAAYRRSFLETVGTKRINAWSREDDEATNEFWDAAYKIATQEFPLLEMKRPKLTKDSKWITFRPRDFPTQPKHVYVSLKGDRGQNDLTFGNTTAHLFRPVIAHLLDSDMFVHQTNASAAIRIETGGFAIADGILEGMPKVRSAFEASSRLIEWYRRSRVEIDQGAKEATPI